jgi:flavin-binding protein dodecin
MSGHIYKSLELTGSSPKGIEDAVERAVKRASKTVHNIKWFEVTDIRGQVEKDKVAQWQVTMKLGFTLDA